jgi:hypothetical protein
LSLGPLLQRADLGLSGIQGVFLLRDFCGTFSFGALLCYKGAYTCFQTLETFDVAAQAGLRALESGDGKLETGNLVYLGLQSGDLLLQRLCFRVLPRQRGLMCLLRLCDGLQYGYSSLVKGALTRLLLLELLQRRM